MRATVDGKLPAGVTAKDIILAIIGEIGTAGGTGYGDRICRRSHPRALDGRAHDDLQHVDRGRRPRRHDRAGREDLRLSQGPAEGAEGQGLGRGAALLGDAALRRWRAFRPRDQARRGQAAAAGHLGHQPRRRRLDHRRGAEPRRDRRRDQARVEEARARLHGPRAGNEDHRHQARPRLHRLLHQRAHRGSARGGPDRRRQDGQRESSTR